MGLKKAIRNITINKGLRSFSLLYVVFFILGLVLLAALKHGDIVLFINKYSREEWDSTVNFITDLGLGSLLAVVMLLMVFIRIRYAVMGLFNLVLVGITTNIFKNILFPERIRPLNYFLYDDFTRFIYIADLNYYQSFPSGHTMAIFAVMCLMSYFTGKRTLGVLFFITALVIGFSRMYLCQHFFLDVFVGSVLGVILSLLTILIGDYFFVLNQRSLFQKSIIRIFRK